MRRNPLILFALSLALTGARSALAQQYQVVDLGVLPGHTESRAWGMNGQGQVVGWSGTGSSLRAVLHDPVLGLLDLGTLPGRTNSAARAISDAGHVVGSSWSAPITQPGEAFLRDPAGNWTALGSLPGGTTSEAFAVNATGTVVGQAQGGAFSPEPFLSGPGGGLTSLSNGVVGNAWAVDEAGWVAGERNGAAVLWDPTSTLHTLPSDPNLPLTRAQAINGSRHCAGIARDASATVAHLVLWDASGQVDLGIVGRYSQVHDLNDGGWIVGSDQFSFQVTSRGFLHRPGLGTVFVDDLLDPASQGWQITSVFGVNESGQLAANGIAPGGERRALRLDPTGPVGDLQVTTHCIGRPNSTGQAALLEVTQLDLAASTMTFHCSGMPAGRFGISLVSRDAGHVPFVGGGAGDLCLSGTIGRAVGGSILVSSATGTWSEGVDLGQVPQGSGSVPVLPGETWYFQAWYRDLDGSGAPTSNLSSGLRVRF